MNRRSFLAALLSTPALAAIAAACGDTRQASTYSFPRQPDDVVLRVGYEGGFVAPGSNFVNLPAVLISGDGRVFSPGPMVDSYPGPLLPAVLVRSISDQGIQKVLRLAADAGLLRPPPDYSLPPDVAIADAADTVVAINVNGTTYVHRANALGLDVASGGASTPARDDLQQFVTLVTDVAKVAGTGNVGAATTFAPERYRFQAMAVDPSQWTAPSPTIREWPTDAGAVLADSGQCASVPAGTGARLFATATQLTFFQEGDQVYQLAVIGVLPGDATC